MLIQNMQQPVGELKGLSTHFLAKLAVGQRIEAVALTAAVTNELVKLKVQQSLFEIKTPWPLQQGQKVVLEVAKALSGNNLVLNLVSEQSRQSNKSANIKPLVTPTTQHQAINLGLQVGHKVAAEVISQQPNKSLIVAPIALQQRDEKIISALPKKIEIDITQFSRPFKSGDKLELDIVKLNPLSVNIKPVNEQSAQQQRIIERVKQLLPQQQAGSQQLTAFSKALQSTTLPAKIETSIVQLAKNIIDTSTIKQPEKLQQAIQNSGVFLERQLLQKPQNIDADFKANLQQLFTNVKAVLDEYSTQQLGQKSETRSLPVAIQTALENILSTPKELSKIPEHVRQTLTTTGIKPAQLLTVLLTQIDKIELPIELRQIIEQQQSNKQTQANLTNRMLTVELVLLRELLREIETTTTKIQMNQLMMLREADSGSPSSVWLLDLPLKDKSRIDLVQMRIEQNKHNPFEQEGDIWQVDLKIDTVNLGPMHAAISLHEQDVKVVLKAQREQSVALLEDNIALLQSNLSELGVSVSHLSCICDSMDADSQLASFNQQLIDSLIDISV